MNINSTLLRKGLLQAQKMSPTALMVVGVTGIVTAGVLACRATLKGREVVDEINGDLIIAKEMREDKDLTEYDDKAYAKEILKISAHAAGDFAKLYAVPIGLAAVSIVCISGGHAILLKRNAALAATQTMTEKAYASYRKAVAAEIGEEKERDIRFSKTVERIDDTKAGEVKEVATYDPTRHSQYARFFDESNKNWERASGYNRVFLQAQQDWANRRLHAYGYLLLNDVYEALGFERTSAGAVVGWVENGQGDNYIDFGMYDAEDERVRAFVNEDERSILLDFNVDGVVFDLIDKVR